MNLILLCDPCCPHHSWLPVAVPISHDFTVVVVQKAMFWSARMSLVHYTRESPGWVPSLLGDCHMQPCTACGLSHWQPEESTSSGRRHLLTCMDLSVFMGFWKTVILRGWKRGTTTTKTQWVSDWKETVQVSPLQSRKFSPGRVRDPTYAVQQLKMDWN